MPGPGPGVAAAAAPPPATGGQQQPAPALKREPPLTLARAPLRTLYYFGWSVASGLRDAAHFVATHPVTLFMALPALAYYGAAKAFGYAPAHTEAMEVRRPARAVARHQSLLAARAPASRRRAAAGSARQGGPLPPAHSPLHHSAAPPRSFSYT